MAGIGFELKRMFRKKGLFAKLRAYGYAGIVCIGPMILGMTLLLGIRFLAQVEGIPFDVREIANSMITYTLLASIFITNIFSLVTTRFVADQIFVNKTDRILSSFWGSITIMLFIGDILYGIFLHFSGAQWSERFICFLVFEELIIVWTEINYLTAIKDYRGIMNAFSTAVVIGLISGYFLVKLGVNPIDALLLIMAISYGVMAVWYYYLLVQYFPKEKGSILYFLKWIDKYPQLGFIGLFIGVGLFGHIIIMWTASINHQVLGLFYEAPTYDVAALLAFFSILATTINFVTSVEVHFYPKYKNYFSLFNDGGSFVDIEQAEEEMVQTLLIEMRYTFIKQLFVSVCFIVFGSYLFPKLPLGITEDMIGAFRVLCIGYAFYAIGNCIMLIQLYFSDNKGAFISTLVFAVASNVCTVLTVGKDIRYLGIGFLAGTVIFAVTALVLLLRYLKKLKSNILCSQPIVVEERRGIFTKLSVRAERRYWEKREKREKRESRKRN